MAPWESDSEVGSSEPDSDVESGSDEECTSSGHGDLDAESPQDMRSEIWKKEFFDRLSDIETYGDFACMTRCSHHINPGLEVAGSLIPLPLVSRDADMIKSKCEQAPFGRGDDTVVDVSVRKTWQLDASLFHCTNPAWASFLDTVLQETVQKLSMPKGTQAVPWKLLLYEEGSFFRPHKDSEKAPGMIGTLVISLPSKHEGGQVHLSHSNKHHVFATSEFSSFDLTALAWYSDVTHEIKPLSSGYRLVITYNLLQQGVSPSAGLFIEQQSQLQALLQQWASALPSETRIIYRLDHKYSQSSLSIQNMKGRDAQLTRCLQQACQETGLYVLLATMTKTESCEDEDYGYDENSLQLDQVTSLDGSYITRSVGVEMSEILGPDPYKDRSADSEDEGEFTGNESMPSQYRYHDSALLIVTSSGLIDFAKLSRCSAGNLFRIVFDSTPTSPSNPGTRYKAISFLDSLLDNFGSSIRSGGLFGMALRASKLWSYQPLYNKAMRKASKAAQDSYRCYFSHESLVAPDKTRSPTSDISKTVAEFVNEFFPHATDQDWNECLSELVQGLDNPTSLNIVLEHVEEVLDTEELKRSFRCWRSSVETAKFEARDTLTILDLPFILSLIRSHSTDNEWASTRLLPKLSQCAEKQLLYPLLHELCAENEHLALKDTESLARRFLAATLSKLNLEIDDLEPRLQRPPQSPKYLWPESDSNRIAVRNLTAFENLLESCFMCLLEEQGMTLLRNSHENLSEAISRLPPKSPKRSNIEPWEYRGPTETDRTPAEKFLASLVVIFHKYSLLDPPPFVRDFFILLFTRYILPDQPNNTCTRTFGWAHKPRFCSRHNPSRDKIHGTCHECALMQDFILSPDQRQGRFTYAKKIRAHLEMVLPRRHYRCETDSSSGSGYCHTLVVTKIGQDTEFDEDMEHFAADMRRYEHRLMPFRQPVVRRILGNETYKRLIMVEPVSTAMSTVPVSTKRAADDDTEQPASKRQRMEDVIDLTDE